MEVKDYLKYYIGQEMLCTDKQNDECMCGSERHTISWVNLSPESDNRNWVLLLRPLSDITEDEFKVLVLFHWKEYPENLIVKWRASEFKKNIVRGNGMGYDLFSNTGHHMKTETQSFSLFEPEQFHYLLSKGFDLFNLIEQNLAIIKTLIK